MNLNWKSIMSTVVGDDRFYMDTEEDEVTPKEAGWEFLRMFGKDDDNDEESEEESGYSANSDQEEVSVSSEPRLSSTMPPKLITSSPRKSQRRKKTLILRRMTSQISTPTMIWKNRAWIGMTWSVKPRRMTKGRRGTESRTIARRKRKDVAKPHFPFISTANLFSFSSARWNETIASFTCFLSAAPAMAYRSFRISTDRDLHFALLISLSSLALTNSFIVRLRFPIGPVMTPITLFHCFVSM